MPSVVVLGSLHLDYLVHIPYIPRKGETLKGEDLQVQPGGKGANQAYYSALQGAATAMIGRVGDDAMGETQTAALVQAGVNVDRVVKDPTAKSGMSMAMIDDDSDYGAVIVSAANMKVSRGDVDSCVDLIKSADCLIMQYEIPLETVLYAARLAGSNGVKVVLNAAPAYPSAEILAETDLLIVNEIEAEMLLDIPAGSPDETLGRLKRLTAPAMRVVTLGSAGLVFASADDAGFIPSHKVAVKDAHGAGDCFVGSLAARLAMGDSLRQAAEYGNAAAAVSVSHSGPRSLVTPEEVRQLMKA
ncbi:MAG: ribokinase [Planctomycetes bacterium]|nr:ribokinase [Planctomycetota bacterium]